MSQRPTSALVQQHRLPSFQHERLKLNANSIRLVQVHGTSNKAAPLSLRITQYAKHKRPPYAAISYTWGSSADLRAIQINGKPFYVHTNLYNLLSHLRQRGESRFLWVDALCIDQANLAERNFHVQLMAQIYDEAATAIVWLGDPSDDRREARAIDFVTEMAVFLAKQMKGGPTFPDLYLTTKTHPRWTNLDSFCYDCVYWSRTWIIQEFLQARNIEVICGTAQLDWTLFSTVFAYIRDAHRSGKTVPKALEETFAHILNSIPARLTARRLSSEASPLQDLIHEFYDAQCSEPRDKVYGMLGIANDCGEHAETGIFRGPQPDYAKHILDVYFDVITYLRDTSPTSSVSPLTIHLLQRSLHITKPTLLNYLSQHTDLTWQTKLNTLSFLLHPIYINPISEKLTWSSIRDLRNQLTAHDWSPYVGYTITPRPIRTQTPSGSPRPASASLHRSSRTMGTLPPSLIPNTLALAEAWPQLTTLYNYHPLSIGLHLPNSLLSTHHEDKLFLSTAPPSFSSITTISRPALIIESSPLATPLRLGFAPPGTRRGDLIVQFRGTELTLICRRPVYAGQSLQLVGRGVMVRHENEGGRHPVCSGGPWVGGCLEGTCAEGEDWDGWKAGGEGEVLETDAVSMFEMLRGGEEW